MRLRTLAVLLLLALFAGSCASGSGTGVTPGSANRPPLQIRQVGAIFFGSSYSTPVSFDIAIANDTAEPMKIVRITIQDAGMVQYQIRPTARDFRKTIEPGKAEKFSMVATAETDIARLTPNEPLTMRITVDADQGEKRFRWLYLRENAD